MRIRPATVTDSATIGHIQLESWRTMFPDAGIDAEKYLAEFSDEERAEDWHELLTLLGEQSVSRSRFGSIPPSPSPSPARREGENAPGKPLPLYGGGVWGGGPGQDRDLQIVYVAENDAGQVVGFALGALDHIAAPYQCELSAIHILPSYRGQGIGKRLIAAVANQFKIQGCSSLWLSVLTGNSRARHLYERLGGQFVSEKRATVGKNEVGIEIAEAAYGWSDIENLLDHLAQ
ncbi:MAG: GNAT family N-acetyltransferase [Aggregatilineales bacterium]